MDKYDNTIIRNKSLTLIEKILAILLLVSVFASLMVPISQAAYKRQIELEKSALNREIIELEEQKNLIKVDLAESSLPTQTLQRASNSSLFLRKIAFDQIKVVTVGEEQWINLA